MRAGTQGCGSWGNPKQSPKRLHVESNRLTIESHRWRPAPAAHTPVDTRPLRRAGLQPGEGPAASGAPGEHLPPTLMGRSSLQLPRGSIQRPPGPGPPRVARIGAFCLLLWNLDGLCLTSPLGGKKRALSPRSPGLWGCLDAAQGPRPGLWGHSGSTRDVPGQQHLKIPASDAWKCCRRE